MITYTGQTALSRFMPLFGRKIYSRDKGLVSAATDSLLFSASLIYVVRAMISFKVLPLFKTSYKTCVLPDLFPICYPSRSEIRY